LQHTLIGQKQSIIKGTSTKKHHKHKNKTPLGVLERERESDFSLKLRSSSPIHLHYSGAVAAGQQRWRRRAGDIKPPIQKTFSHFQISFFV